MKSHKGMASPNSSDAAGLRIQDLRSIMDALVDVQSDWKSIGIALGLPRFDLDSIQNAIPNSSTALSDTLKLWLQSERHPTVERLASVLQDIGQAIIAQKLTEKFTYHNDGKFTQSLYSYQAGGSCFHKYSTHAACYKACMIVGLRKVISFVPRSRPQLLARKIDHVNQVEFLGLAHAFGTV